MAFHRQLQRLDAFCSTPQNPTPLGAFRVAIALFILLQLAVWHDDWIAFVGPDGWVQWEISRAQVMWWNPHLARLHALGEPWGLTAMSAAWGLYWAYAATATGLLVGWYTRFWAIACWLCHAVLLATIPAFVYGVDIFLHIALFYLIVMPVGRAWSLDRAIGRASGAPTWGVTLSLRVLQAHLCFVYASAGVEKARSADWWNGSTLWRSLVQPDFRQFDLEWLALTPGLVVALSVFTIVIESGYPLAMWIPRLRVAWLAGIVSLHVGIMLFLGLRLFGLIMIILSVGAFGREVWMDLQRFRSWQPLTRIAPIPTKGFAGRAGI